MKDILKILDGYTMDELRFIKLYINTLIIDKVNKTNGKELAEQAINNLNKTT
jgi:hypothetical protein